VERTFDIWATFLRQKSSALSTELNVFNFGDNVDCNKLSNSTLSPICKDERHSRNDVTIVSDWITWLMHKRRLCSRAVAGCLSVTFVYCVETAKDRAIVAMECE